MRRVGALHPLTRDGDVDTSIPSLELREGSVVIGRNDLPFLSKNVSRKHVSITTAVDGLVEIFVEGQNPIVLQSGTVRNRLFPKTRAPLIDGDVIEMLPNQLAFKYVVPNNAEAVHANECSRSIETCARPDDLDHNIDSVQVHQSLAIATTCNPVNNPEENRIPIHLYPSSKITSTGADSSAHIVTLNIQATTLIDDDELARKRKSQVIEDEAFARTLQEEEDMASRMVLGTGLVQNYNAWNKVMFKQPRTDQAEVKRRKPELDTAFRSSNFHLLRVQGLPQWSNKGSVSIQDIIQGDIQLAILSNYMVDSHWLLSACPLLKEIPKVVIIHGESGGSLESLQSMKPSNWIFYKPPLRLSYGTHHSKAMFLVYRTGVRIVVHTANYIHIDWNNKTQGLWMQDFPSKCDTGKFSSSDFENDLVEYLEALEWSGCTMTFPVHGETKINAGFFRKFDYSCASVRLIASIPGYHKGLSLTKWGHMKLRTVLQGQLFDNQFQGAPLVYQFSSLGSLDEKWMSEFGTSMSSGYSHSQKPLGSGKVQVVWPTVEDIRCSLEGYAAGGAVPSPLKNVTKDFLTKYWSRWKADHLGRSRAIPHMKSYTRYNGQSIAWFLLTSANLSKAAWGALQKNGTQLMIRSYELGVCFLPSLVAKYGGPDFSCIKKGSIVDKGIPVKHGSCEETVVLVTSRWDEETSDANQRMVIKFPVPYILPPPPYGSEDKPWSWDRQYLQLDVHGQTWPQRV